MNPVGMKTRFYTVKDVARMAGVGIKTLHHYDDIGLLPPLGLSPAGYRLYGRPQIERLQQILFYRELGFPLKHINALIEGSGDRLADLRSHRTRLLDRQGRLGRLIATLERTIACTEGDLDMSEPELFEGFKSATEWNDALSAHNDHLKATYDADVPAVTDAGAMNDTAQRAVRFMSGMAAALRDGKAPGHDDVRALVGPHIAWLIEQGHLRDATGFVAQTQFFIDDDFHRGMLETQQTGLSYFLNAAARAYLN